MRFWLPMVVVLPGALCLSLLSASRAGEKAVAERGLEVIRARSFSQPLVSVKAYENVWKQWGMAEKPADYPRTFLDRYGLHRAPYDNGGLPLGLGEARTIFGGKGIGSDCLMCHAGSVAGQTYIGLGNVSLDVQSLFEELFTTDGLKAALPPFKVGTVRGTIEATASFVYLLQFRDADLNLRAPVAMSCRDDLCQDVPAWWTIKRKKHLYHTGTVSTRSVRTMMAFELSPFNSADAIKKLEPAYADLQAYLASLEPPRYPFPIDARLAARGKELFNDTCARCHGTYGPGGTYPDKIVPLDTIGTDRSLAEGFPARAAEEYVKNWLAQEKIPGVATYRLSDGYQAPPLDGIWATAPYLHNGSVPTVYDLLNSKARPKIFTRTYRTGKEDYDPTKLGLKITVLDRPANLSLPGIERRKVYDTTQPGRGNGGHPFGDKLSEDERMAVIEYLKTL